MQINQIGYHSIALEMIYNFVFETTAIRVECELRIRLKVRSFCGVNEREFGGTATSETEEKGGHRQCSWLIQLQVETDSTLVANQR